MQTFEQLISGELKGVKELKLSCGLTEFPSQIFELAETLEFLDLSKNQLSSLPANFGLLKKLKVAFFSYNNFTEFPHVLADCPALTMIGFRANEISYIPENALPKELQWLILTGNKIEMLPDSIGECTKLKKFAIAGNKLRELPDSMANCKHLELLRISANELKIIPDWLFTLPRLSWLAYAGNPCCVKVSNETTLRNIAWNELKIGEQLGEGASGNIHKAIWNGDEVAVKIFKGEVTSDGYPEDELDMCIAAGLHENLVLIIGKVGDHPEGKHVLVMELISSEYKNLGNPPTFETCTRDVFPKESFFSAGEILNISMSVVSAVLHLHEKGILHGDLYAHNTMVDSVGNALLGDFGAATPYDKSSLLAFYKERIDVRAYGCFLEDLLNLLPDDEDELDTIQLLTEIKDNCQEEDSNLRNNFSTIYHQLIDAKNKIRLKYT